MLMLTLLMSPVNSFGQVPAESTPTPPAAVFIFLLLVVGAVFVWALRQLQPALVVVAELFRVVILTALVVAVIIGALVLVLSTAVVN